MQLETISLRMSDQQRTAIDLAAESCGKSRAAFIVESAVTSAHNMLQDRTHLILNTEQWNALLKALDEPVDVEAMRHTLEMSPPWKES